MVQRQSGHRLRYISATVDDGGLFLREELSNACRQRLARARGNFRHFHHGAIAGGERANERPQRQVERIVPRRDDAYDTERLLDDPRTTGLEPDRYAAPFIAHPARHMAARMTN